MARMIDLFGEEDWKAATGIIVNEKRDAGNWLYAFVIVNRSRVHSHAAGVFGVVWHRRCARTIKSP